MELPLSRVEGQNKKTISSINFLVFILEIHKTSIVVDFVLALKKKLKLKTV
jgi:hypothetical protein